MAKNKTNGSKKTSKQKKADKMNTMNAAMDMETAKELTPKNPKK